MTKAIRIFLFLFFVAVAYVLNRLGILQRTLDWIESYGPLGPFVFVGVYVLATLFFVPSFIFTFSSGILFGIAQGCALSVLGCGLGSVSAFCIGRYFAHDWVEKRMAHHQEFQRLSRAVANKGWKVIFLARLSPIFPFSIGNYAFGLTRIQIKHYFFASVLGTIPSALLFSYLGFVTGSVSGFQGSDRARTPGEWGVLGLGLAATVFLAWYLRKIAEKDSDQY